MSNEELFLLSTLSSSLGTDKLALVPRTAEADGLLVAGDRNPNTEGAKLVLGTDSPYRKLDAIRDGVRSGAIKVLLSFGEDLVTDAGFTTEDLAKPEFLLHVHTLANPTASAAHVVLPAATFAEKRGSMINLSGRLQRLNKAVQPPGTARDDWEILRDLIVRRNQIPLSDPEYPHELADIFRDMAESIPPLKGWTLTKIGPLGVPIIDTGYQIPLLANERAAKAAGKIVG